jgi:hypothetical protein
MSYYRSRWAGRVYDGPLEGEQRIEERPFFEFSFSPDSYLAPIGIEMMCGSTISPICYRMAYVWSAPLRAWVFDWRTAPQPRAGKPVHTGRKQHSVRDYVPSKTSWDVC